MNADPITATLTPDQLWPISRAAWARMVEAGIFDHHHVELIEGRILRMSPESAAHAASIDVLNHWLRALPDGWTGSVQHPFGVGALSEPEPDIAVVPYQGWRSATSERAALIIEVADSSLRHDRQVKTALYAQAGVPEYWIVNLRGRCVEIAWDPADGAYRHAKVVDASGRVAPRAFPDLSIAVADIVPPEPA